ncbi:hypothetical protein FGG08_005268 [Glutinoglossum americanum]|uniref:Ubiquitin carboxyl-terminal hydrolase 14 n=1 Tax=Glutinoglossum americanum TaxID=1670608 RepID=A0A9P8HYR5_9PEZI|nr:hypothetical protein FGG08_005268 [Glutinoglossum americanum]
MLRNNEQEEDMVEPRAGRVGAIELDALIGSLPTREPRRLRQLQKWGSLKSTSPSSTANHRVLITSDMDEPGVSTKAPESGAPHGNIILGDAPAQGGASRSRNLVGSAGKLTLVFLRFQGDPAPNSATTDTNDYTEAHNSLIEQVKLRAAETAKSFMIDMWLARHTPEKVLPLLWKVIEGAKEEFADAVANGEGMYAVGYCFGGKYILLLAGEQPDTVMWGRAPEDEQKIVHKGPLIRAGALAHGKCYHIACCYVALTHRAGTLVTKEDIEAVKSPVKNDQLFPDDVRVQGCNYLKTNNIEHEAKVYKNVPHGWGPTGFAVLGEYDEPKIQEAQKHAFEQMLGWLDDPTGLNVCLHCFNGGCTGERNHGLLHYETQKHPLVLNIKRTRKLVKRDEPPQKISKLAIAAETEADRYDTVTQLRCYECQLEDVDKSSGKLSSVIEGAMNALTFARQEEVKAWELELTPCEHTLYLEGEAARQIESQDLGHCSMCDLKSNLWLCLHCGNLGCGRSQFGAVEGNSHGLAHSNATRHPIAVKLGSITPEGTADIYCYSCDEERTDPELAAHLAHWGINIMERKKTEKSLTEMQIEQNLRWEFSMTTADGKELKPLFGKGLTGLKNLGNSCYLASILQCLFALPVFQERYYRPSSTLPISQQPAEDLETQLRKIADGLLSGRYSQPDSDVRLPEHTSDVPYQRGLAPSMLKALVGRGHADFASMQQQDAFDLLLHLLKLITRSKHPAPLSDPVRAFKFILEQRLQCLSCKRVRYKSDEQEVIPVPVPARKKSHQASSHETGDEDRKESTGDEFEPVTFKECLDIFTSEEIVELECSSCGSKGGFSKRSLFKTFPGILAVNARRFKLVNWVPTKLDIPVVIGDEPFALDQYKSPGPQPDEELFPESADTSSKPSFVPNETAINQLESIGFPRVRSEKALHATGNNDVEAATNWLFAHMEDPDIDAPVNLGDSSNSRAANIDPGKIEMLGAMGFGPSQARKALGETGGDVERAVEWLFNHPDDQGGVGDDESEEKRLPGSETVPAYFQLHSIVCHKGASIHAGHYVAFIRKNIGSEHGDSWVLFNDEKVVEAADFEEMKRFAYVYFFRHV